MASTIAQTGQPVSLAKRKKRSLGYAALVAAGILLSRVAGLIRERVFAYYFGSSDAAGAFKAAIRIPNFLQNLFGEGVLSASFIPVYARLVAEGEEQLAGRVAGVVATILVLWVSILVLIGVLLTPWLVDLVAPGFHGAVRELTVSIVRVLFPGIGLLVISAWCLGILNSHRKFFVSYVAPVFWNAAMITAMILFGRRQSQDTLAITLSWGTVVGAGLQLGVQLPFVFRNSRLIRFGLQTALEPVREIFRNLGPVLVSRGVVQVSAYVDGMIASFLGAAAVASLGYAQTLYLLPISVFGMSIAAAELPEMSSALGTTEEANAKIRARLEHGQRNIAFFVIPSVAGFIFLGKLIVAALYQTGRFTPDNSLYVWYILLGATLGLLAATWGRLYSSAFYALRDTRTPLNYAVVRVSLTAALGVLFAFPLRPVLVSIVTKLFGMPIPHAAGGEIGIGVVGLTASAGIAAWVEYLLLSRSMSRRIGSTHVPALDQVKLWASALLAGILGYSLHWRLLSPIVQPRPGLPILELTAALAIFGVVYLGLTRAMGIPQAKRLLRI